jgi:formylglycine-generating enzyme required for sulfatase activity
MKAINCSLLFILALSASTAANAAGSKLRITCEGDDVGAEVLINGKFRGECPIDLAVPAGRLKLVVRKDVDASHERAFEQEIRMGEDSAKKVEAVLTTRLNAAAQKREDAKMFAEIAEGMVVIPAGSFEMGSSNGDADEQPMHRVTIARAFALGKTEVTQGQWRAVMGSNPSSFSNCGDNCPVENVSWDDAQAFIQKLNARTGKHYRLPSEAEWEYACRAGGQQEYCGGDNLDSVAWYGAYANPVGNSAKTTNPVATRQANAFGLYDMSGNVWEWVADSYHDSYNGAPSDGGEWQGGGAKRVLRGGSWYFDPQYARAANRDRDEPAIRIISCGFRLARMLP